MYREYVHWWSGSLNRGMEFLWFGHAGRPVLIFPTSGGRFFENEDFGLTGALQPKVAGGEIQLICVDTINTQSWFDKSIHPGERVRRHDLYDRYLRHELIPYIHERSKRDDLAVFGASFGAYQASNLAGRHPELVRKAILFSGIYDIHAHLDGYWDDNCYFHCPTAYIPNLDGEWSQRLARIEWIIATGEHDHLVQINRDFSALLWSKGIPNHSEFWSGAFGHDWPWWKGHLPRFLP